MFLSLRSVSSRKLRPFTPGLLGVVLTVSSASAVSTSVSTASLSFRVTSSNGPLHFSSPNLNGDAALTAVPPPAVAGYSDSTGNTSLSGSDAIGANTVSTSSSVNADSFFTSTSSVNLALPPFSSSSGQASSYNYIDIDITDLRPVNGFFDIKFSSVLAQLSLSLGTDANGVSAFGGASWFVSLNYTLPGGDESGSNTLALSKSIGTTGSFSETSTYTNSFEFSGIPAGATDVQLYWETSAEARALEGTPRPVPDGGTALVLLGLGLGGMECLRRKWKGAHLPSGN